MTISIYPPITVFVPKSQTQALPNKWRAAPPEGDFQFPIEIDWDGTTVSWQVNLVNLGLTNWSAIRSIFINNESCGSALRIVAPDTGQICTVPPFSCGLYYFYSPGKNIFVSCIKDAGTTSSAPYAPNGDVTYITFYNSVLPPIPAVQSVPPILSTKFNIGLAAGTFSVAILAASVTGTIRGIHIDANNLIGAAGGGATWTPMTLVDGDGNNHLQFGFAILASQQVNYQELLNITDPEIRFINGLTIAGTMTGTAPTQGFLTGTIWYTAR